MNTVDKTPILIRESMVIKHGQILNAMTNDNYHIYSFAFGHHVEVYL